MFTFSPVNFSMSILIFYRLDCPFWSGKKRQQLSFADKNFLPGCFLLEVLPKRSILLPGSCCYAVRFHVSAVFYWMLFSCLLVVRLASNIVALSTSWAGCAVVGMVPNKQHTFSCWYGEEQFVIVAVVVVVVLVLVVASLDVLLVSLIFVLTYSQWWLQAVL